MHIIIDVISLMSIVHSPIVINNLVIVQTLLLLNTYNAWSISRSLKLYSACDTSEFNLI